MKDWIIRNGVWTLEEAPLNTGTSCSTNSFNLTSGEETRFRILVERLDRIIELLERG